MDYLDVARNRELSAQKFTSGQLVRHDNRKAVVVSQTSRSTLIEYEDNAQTAMVPTFEVQPRSIKKSYGVEGKNFID